jgi:hypothetical protein
MGDVAAEPLEPTAPRQPAVPVWVWIVGAVVLALAVWLAH